MNKILVLNGSPRRDGIVYTLLKEIIKCAEENNEIEWIDIYNLQMEPCIGCMKCRTDDTCVLPKDDAHIVGEKIKKADVLIVGTPTYWGNMSAQLKVLFERNVPVFMGEKASGIPLAKQKGKRAVIVVSCTTPWPFNFIAAESRGAVSAVKEVLHYGGYKVTGKIVKPGTKINNNISEKILSKARKIGSSL
ncbi:flavodoxin family protein [Marinisporobacter balticus]|uniref:Multimeric flavodoxin WrbA n=1 Tax=Marinisporobacter balticus TaxID=2018667 RepID=A0A4R2KQF5_9FIRM|nr:flavodoxin family protein [Marinisporobacter balticus]TCO74932.1 multimeric flavodoxin WrbA [Marinisporobacter balticus]